MDAALLGEVRSWRRALSRLKPSDLPVESCVSLVEALAELEKAAVGLRVRAAARVAAVGSRRIHSEGDAAEWLARATGTSTGAAKSAIETAGALEKCPRTAKAVSKGKLSLEQAREITKCEEAAPGSEEELVRFAREHSLRGLKEETRKRRLAAVDPRELHDQQQAARELRHWRDELGMVAISARLSPAAGVRFLNRMDAETDRLWRAASAEEKRDLPRKYFAGIAFERLVSGEATTTGNGRTDLVVVADLNAFRRGHAHDGEPVHVVGGGPIPVEVARELAHDAFVKGVLHDGVNVHHVWHAGRYRKAELRTALELGAAPEFSGTVCSIDCCDRRYGLEWDHKNPVANGGPTTFDNIDAKCHPHHVAKTEADRGAGLLNGGRSHQDDRGPP